MSAEPRIFDLPGPVVSGHPERHVARVMLPSGEMGFLKREFRVPLRDRVRNWLAGFGWVGRSLREATVLRALETVGLPGPRVVAAGTVDHGRAFVLLRDVGGVDLRIALAEPDRRRELARLLGRSFARLDAAGFEHPDPHAKHVRVSADRAEIMLLDWQRGRFARRGDYGSTFIDSVVKSRWRRRAMALAVLNASLADELASPRDRFAVLRALGIPRGQRRAWARLIVTRTAVLRQRRDILEQHHAPRGEQSLLWLAGESLCATSEAAALFTTEQLDQLAYPASAPSSVRRETLTLPDGRPAILIRRIAGGFGFRSPWSLPKRAPELRQAGVLFRLARHGIPAPKLLAFGQRGSASFLLAATEPGAVPISETNPAVARLQAALHAACCRLVHPLEDVLAITPAGTVVIADPLGVEIRRRCRRPFGPVRGPSHV